MLSSTTVMLLTIMSSSFQKGDTLLESSTFRLFSTNDYVHITTIEYAIENDGKTKKPDTSMSKYDWISGKFGEKSLKVMSVRRTGEELTLMEIKEDGKRRTELVRTPEGKLYHVDIQFQKSKGHEASEVLFAALWLMIPGGKPLEERIKNGEAVVEAGGKQTNTLVKFTHKGKQVVCELSAEYNGAIETTTVFTDAGRVTYKVTKFQKYKDMFVPQFGVFNSINTSKTSQNFGFELSRFETKDFEDKTLFTAGKIDKDISVLDITKMNKFNKIQKSEKKAIQNVKLVESFDQSKKTSTGLNYLIVTCFFILIVLVWSFTKIYLQHRRLPG